LAVDFLAVDFRPVVFLRPVDFLAPDFLAVVFLRPVDLRPDELLLPDDPRPELPEPEPLSELSGRATSAPTPAAAATTRRTAATGLVACPDGAANPAAASPTSATASLALSTIPLSSAINDLPALPICLIHVLRS
jgi:hypothetical protein